MYLKRITSQLIGPQRSVNKLLANNFYGYSFEPSQPLNRQPEIVSTAEEAVQCIQSYNNVFIHGAAAIPFRLIKAMTEYGRTAKLKNITLNTLYIIEPADYLDAELKDTFRMVAFFISGNARTAVTEGRADAIPIFLQDIPKLFHYKLCQPDVALISVSPPDQHGYCSLGTSIDITAAALSTSKKIIAQINKQVPRTFGDSIIHQSHFDYAIYVDDPLPTYGGKPPSDNETVIGRLIAEHLIDDGATLQMGIGNIPDAVLTALKNHKHLGIHTEMFSDGVVDLMGQGCVTNSRKPHHKGRTVGTFVMGTRKVYDYIDNNPYIEMLDCSYVNNPGVIARNPKMTAINACIEVDLTGQICSDSIGTLMYSGFGGQVDFMRGAAEGFDGKGKPIIALQSVTARGESKIVPILKPGSGVVTSRAHVHYVVTEYGIAYLFGKTLRQRAHALIQIAHPDHREALERASFERLKCMPSAELF